MMGNLFKKLVLAALCLALPVGALAASLAGASIYNLESVWMRQDGVKIHLDSLQGRPLIVAMVYTSCTEICPLIVEDMKKIEAALPPQIRDKVGFALFSFDPARDTPKRLQAFAQERGLNLHHWALFHGEAKAVRELAAVLGVRYRRDANGDFDHAAILSFLDADGIILDQKTGAPLGEAERADMVRKITEKCVNLSP